MLPGRDIELRFGNGIVNASRVRPGDLVWRTHDPSLEKSVRTIAAHKQPVRVHATAHAGEPLRLRWSVGGLEVETVSDSPLESAQNRAITEGLLTAQLGRLGNTPYQLASISLDAQGSPFAPASLLNQLRRQAVDLLQALQAQLAIAPIADPIAALHRLTQLSPEPAPSAPQLHLLVRTPEQLDAALAVRPASITLDYLDLYGLLPSLDRVKASGIEARIASPRVLKPGEERIAAFLLKCDCPILVRSAGLLETLSTQPHRAGLTGDFSLNAANAITAHELLSRGLDRLALHSRSQRRPDRRARSPHRPGAYRSHRLPAPSRLPH